MTVLEDQKRMPQFGSLHRLILIIPSALAISFCWTLSWLAPSVRSHEFGGAIRKRLRRVQDRSGTTTKTIQVDGITRSYLVHVPLTYPNSKSHALVLVFHGGESQAQQMERYTRMSDLADRNGFIVAYPEGVNKHWNDGRPGAPDVNDVGFVRTLIDGLERDFKIDRKRIYATGISNGGMFTQRLACELSGTIAAVATVAASMPTTLSERCKPMSAISILMMHGTNDPLVPYLGGPLPKTTLGGEIVSVPNAVRYWADTNRCSAIPVRTSMRDTDPNDGTRVAREVYGKCENNTEVILYSVEGGGHTLPGGRQYLPERLVGTTSRDIDGSETIWNFFSRHSLR